MPLEILPVNASSTLNFSYLARVCVIALFLVLSLIYLARTFFPNIPNDLHRKKLAAYQQQRKLMQALVVGSSHSRGFHLPSLGLNGFNFHDVGGDVEELSMKAAIFLKKSPQLHFIFVPVSPGTLAISQRYIVDSYQARALRVANNTPLSVDLFLFAHEATMSLLIDRFISIKKFRQALDHFIKPYFSKDQNTNRCFLLLDDKAVKQQYSVSVDDDIFDIYPQHIMKPGCMEYSAKTTALKHMKVFKTSVKKEPAIVQHNMQRLTNLADKLSKRAGKLVLVITPLTKPFYQSSLIQALVPKHLSHLAELEKHPNIEVYDFHDYFYDNLTDQTNDYFYDSTHLALTGAIEFSKALKLAMGI